MKKPIVLCILDGCGIRVFIYDNTYNKNEDRFDRVYNWKEIYDKIKNQH